MVWRISLSIEQVGVGAELRVEYSNELLIGRTAPADILLDSAKISRRHCWLRVSPSGEASVEDAGSSGGTYYNGAQLRGVQPFTESDSIQIGEYTFKMTEPPSQE